MKKLLYTLLAVSLIFSACKKEEEEIAINLDLENTILGKEWSLTTGNGFLMAAENRKFYLTEECQPNTRSGNWEIILDSIYPILQYKYEYNSQEITIVLGKVIEYSESKIKLLINTGIVVTYVYVPDVYGCTDIIAPNYDATATCDDGSCIIIGSTYQGGIIFHLDGNGGGLIAAPINVSTAQWGCWGRRLSVADGTAIGTGAQNTIDIINANCNSNNGSPTAADICANLTLGGYNDWFLPSKDELNKMYVNLHQQGLGGFGGFLNYYWSSTNYDDYRAWGQSFSSGSQSYSDKEDYVMPVRAVRAF
tara:strand:- start:36 stop:956 length:921 start_codon:yes stop_codon:yes gene_type:complete